MHVASASARQDHRWYGLLAAFLVGTLLAATVAIAITRDDGSESSSGVIGSGVSASETRALPAFTAIDLTGVNDVTIGVGGQQLVTVRGDDNLVPLVTTEVTDGTLVIAESESIDTTSPMSVEVTVPSLDAVRLTGTGVMTVDGHDLEQLTISLAGTGTLRAAGSVSQLDVELLGTGDVELRELVSEVAIVELAGTGDVFVNVTRTLDASLSGIGTIYYSGNPGSVTRKVTGAGAIVEE
jgi:hypothetical protein